MANVVSLIDKLVESNYFAWSIHIISLVITLGLWDTIEGESPKGQPRKLIGKHLEKRH